MRVYLVRHGQAQAKEIDPERRLTPVGEAQVRKMALTLRPLQLCLGYLWHSGKPRAAQTAGIIATAVTARNGPKQHDGLKPNDPVEVAQQIIESSREDVMLVGHLPHLGRLAAALITGDSELELMNFATAAVACLDRDAESGLWRLSWLISPEVAG
jgi:phosphohistidine phosphatase